VIYGSFISLLINIFNKNNKVLIVNSFPGLGRLYKDGHILYFAGQHIFELLYRFIAISSKVRSVFQVTTDRQYFLKRNIIQNKRAYVIHGSGVDIRKFYPSNLMERKSKRILMASRMTKEKGVYIYLLACEKINNIYSDVEFLLAGDTKIDEPDKISYDELIGLCKLSGVKYLGHVDAMDVLLRTVDIVVLPTMRREGVPRILVESAFCGIPLVATDSGGCSDIVDHNKNGIIIKKNSVEDLVDAMKLLIENDELRKSYGIVARKNILEEMSSDHVSAEYVNIYKELNDGDYINEK